MRKHVIFVILSLIFLTSFISPTLHATTSFPPAKELDPAQIDNSQYQIVLEDKTMRFTQFAANADRSMFVIAANSAKEVTIVNPKNTSGRTGYTKALYYSPDGLKWTKAKLDHSFQYDQLFGVRWVNDRFIAFGRTYPEIGSARYESYIAYSIDGINWTEVRPRYDNRSVESLAGVSYGNGTYILTGEGHSKQPILLSKDLQSFEKLNLPIDYANVFFFKDKFIAVSTSALAYSTDGKNWTTLSYPVDTKNYSNLIVSPQMDESFTLEMSQRARKPDGTLSHYNALVFTTSNGIDWISSQKQYTTENYSKNRALYGQLGGFIDASAFHDLGNGKYISCAQDIVRYLDLSQNSTNSTKLTSTNAVVNTVYEHKTRKPKDPIMIDSKGEIYVTHTISFEINMGASIDTKKQRFTFKWVPDEFISPFSSPLKAKCPNAFLTYGAHISTVTSQLGEKDMGMTPILVGKNFYIPIKYVLEPFGLTSKYDKAKNILYIDKKK